MAAVRDDTPFEVLTSGFQFVEAPMECDDGSVAFSDLTGGGFYRVFQDGTVETVLADRLWIGGAVINQDGGFILSGQGGLVRVSPNGSVQPLLTEIDGVAIDAINDIEADDDGGIYGGTVDFSAILGRGEMGAPGVLFRLDPGGTLDIVREGVAVSNGIGFSPDRRCFYHSDCGVGVWVYDYAPGGRPRNPALFAALDDSDGLVVDAEGGVWVARWRAAEILRYRPDGVLDRTVRLPFTHLVSMTFGGEDLCSLYIATGGTDKGGLPVGGIVRIRTEVPGQRAVKAKL